jgi:hypothetical protein
VQQSRLSTRRFGTPPRARTSLRQHERARPAEGEGTRPEVWRGKNQALGRSVRDVHRQTSTTFGYGLMKEWAGPLLSACRIAYSPQALLMVCLNQTTSSPCPWPEYALFTASSRSMAASYAGVVGITSTRARILCGGMSSGGKSRVKISTNSRHGGAPRSRMSSLKTSGLDSKGVKCFRYTMPTILHGWRMLFVCERFVAALRMSRIQQQIKISDSGQSHVSTSLDRILSLNRQCITKSNIRRASYVFFLNITFHVTRIEGKIY